MPVRPECIRSPLTPTPRGFVPVGSRPYHVRDGDTWESVSRIAEQDTRSSIGSWGLVRFNFPGLPKDEAGAALEVNWYLEHYVGCRQVTRDQRNYVFSSADNPGMIYLPTAIIASALQAVPLLEGIKERRESISANTPGRIVIEDDPLTTAHPNPPYAIDSLEEVTQNAGIIQIAAHRFKLDEDFLKAIVWIESTHGWYDRFEGPFNKTIRPMNVHQRLWAGLGINRPILDKNYYNVMAGSYLLEAIWERVEDPTYEKVAQLYNQLGAKKVGRYGKTVDFYRRFKPWLKKDSRP